MEDILDVFKRQCVDQMGSKGIYPLPLVWEGSERFNICIMEVGPADVTRFGIDVLLFKGAQRVVWGVDRSNRDPAACGIESKDFLTVFSFNGAGWQYGILEYDVKSGSMKDIDWHNKYWLSVMEKEVIEFFEHTLHLRN